MERINKAAAVGVVFFSVMLAGFVGLKVEQTTISLLAGAALGLAISVPTTVLILVVGLRKPITDKVTPPAQSERVPDSMTWVTHNHYHDNRKVIVVNVPQDASKADKRIAVAEHLRIAPIEAQRMIETGAVKLIEAPRR